MVLCQTWLRATFERSAFTQVRYGLKVLCFDTHPKAKRKNVRANDFFKNK